MKCIEVNNLITDSHYKEIKDLYIESFPPSERIPLSLINKRIKSNYFLFSKYIDESNNDLLGFTLIVTEQSLHYVYFFAVNSSKRNNGIGTSILKQMLNQYSERNFFLLCEYVDKDVPSSDIRVRRLNFYKRNGLVLLPYVAREFSNKFLILGNKEDIDPSPYLDLMKKTVGKLYFYFNNAIYPNKAYTLNKIDPK